MPTGEARVTRVILKRDSKTFAVFVDSAEAVQEWKKDSSIPLVNVLAGFHIYTSDQGAQGKFGAASNAELENEFSTKKVEDVAQIILREGEIQAGDNKARESSTNDSIGSMGGHR